VETGRGRFLPVLSSALAQEILTSGYDARVLDQVYANSPSCEHGLLGRLADRLVLEMPLHQGLRERLEAAVGEICAAAVLAVREGQPEFRLLSAPCGLAAELVGAAERLRQARPEVLSRLRCWGVDPDPEGLFLREAQKRARGAGLEASFLREDLRRHRDVSQVVRREGPFHLASCLGYTQSHSLAELAPLARFFGSILAPGGTLLVDRWEAGERSRRVAGLEVPVECYPVREFQETLRSAGFSLEREHATGEGGCILVVARREG